MENKNLKKERKTLKKIICLMLSFIILFAFSACNEKDMTYGDPDANTSVPADSVATLKIDREEENENDLVLGIGTELDPHFFSQNVGLSGYANDIGSWTCEEEDWDIVVSRLTDMNLKRIRVMLLPSWYCTTEENYSNGIYNWNSDEMNSLYRVLNTAKDLGITVNITMWGCNLTWLRSTDNTDWVTYPKVGGEETFVTIFADAIKYLIQDKNYTEIKEVTLYNEPNSLYNYNSGNDDYCNLCIAMDEIFKTKNIRDKVLFNLSDDARSPVWLAQTLYKLDGIIDIANSHSYVFGDSYNSETNTTNRDMSNDDICYNIPSYNLGLYKEMRSGYENIPHIWG